MSKLYNHRDFTKKALAVCRDMAKLLSEKNLAYGNSFEDVPYMLKKLYPKGVRPDQMDDFLLLVRIFDKIKRIAQNNDPYGEDPWMDIAGYSLLKMITRPKSVKRRKR